MPSILIRNITTLVQAETQARSLARGAEMARLPVVHQAFLLLENDRIAAFGPMDACPERADQTLDASGRLVLPG
ncbi:MAG: imidazolonepropionase, partial [Saprospiraceae bacterium]|nr:imidazolonepropionase [Saprospiraceae bacterium]